jgi:hypothetical protein
MTRQSVHCVQCGDRMGSVDADTIERAVAFVRRWIHFLDAPIRTLLRQSMPVLLVEALKRADAKCARCSDAL